jgi:hypothetical protein
MTTHRSARTRLIVAASLAALVAGASSTAISTAAAKAPARPAAKQALSSYNLFAIGHKAKSSHHQTLRIAVNGSANTSQEGFASSAAHLETATASVTINLPDGSETHNWSFRLKPSLFPADPKAGTATLKSKHTFGKFGQVALKIKPKGKLKQQKPCKTLTYTDRRVSIDGLVRFDTRSGKHGWGKIKIKHFHTTGTLSASYGTYSGQSCGTDFPPSHCPTGLTASVFASGDAQKGANISISAKRSGKASTVYVSRNQLFKNSYSRYDTLQTNIKKLAMRKKNGKQTVTLAGVNNKVVGSATWTATDPPTVSTPDYCTNKVKSTNYNAVFKNGKKPIKFISHIGPPITVKTTYSLGGPPIVGLPGDFSVIG